MFPLLQIIVKQLSLNEKIGLFVIVTAVLLYAPLAQHYLKLVVRIYANPMFRLLEFSLGVLLYAIIVDEKMKSSAFIAKLRSWKTIALEFVICFFGVTIALKMNIIVEDKYMLYSWIGIPVYSLMFVSMSGKNINNYLQDKTMLSFAAEISYTFYLAQFFIWGATLNLSNLSGIDSNPTRFVISFFLCSLIAIMLHWLIELPCKKRLAKIAIG